MAWFRSKQQTATTTDVAQPETTAPPPPPPPPAPTPIPQPPSALETYVDSIGAYAKQPTSAYALSAIYAFIAPLSFPAAQRYSRNSSPSGTVAASPTSTAALPPNSPLRAVLPKSGPASPQAARAALRSLPPFWQLAGLSTIFAGGGYMIQEGDALNGSGTVTAWSLTYLCFNTLATFRTPSIPRLLLSVSTATLGAAVHGSYYFSRTTWRGAIPGLVGTSSTPDARS